MTCYEAVPDSPVGLQLSSQHILQLFVWLLQAGTDLLTGPVQQHLHPSHHQLLLHLHLTRNLKKLVCMVMLCQPSKPHMFKGFCKYEALSRQTASVP